MGFNAIALNCLARERTPPSLSPGGSRCIRRSRWGVDGEAVFARGVITFDTVAVGIGAFVAAMGRNCGTLFSLMFDLAGVAGYLSASRGEGYVKVDGDGEGGGGRDNGGISIGRSKEDEGVAGCVTLPYSSCFTGVRILSTGCWRLSVSFMSRARSQAACQRRS